MKLSEMQEILKKLQDKFGDLEIKKYSVELDELSDITPQHFSATSYDEDNSRNIEHITFWTA